MTLASVYRINGLLGLLWAASFWFGTDMMAASYNWEVTLPMVTMAQYLGMSFLFTAVIFIMLPNWTSSEQLSKATPPYNSATTSYCTSSFSYHIWRYPCWRYAVLWNWFK